MKLTIICECCNKPTEKYLKEIQSTILQEDTDTGVNVFSGFVCTHCKREINNAAFAEFKRLKAQFKNK